MPEPYEQLDEAMNHRRLELRMSWRQAADAASISYTAIRAIRRGDYRPTELTARALDEAFRWRAGSTEAVLAGGSPTPLEAGPSGEPQTTAPSVVPASADWVPQAMQALLETLPLRDRPAALRRLEELIEEEDAAECLQDSNTERPERNAM